MSRFVFILFLFIGIVCTSCKKKEIQGPKGDPGVSGKGGNSNFTSFEFTVSFAQWVADSTAGVWKAVINTPLITKSVIEKGSVKLSIAIGTDWWELPYYEGDRVTQYGFKEGALNMTVVNIHGGLPQRPLTSSYRMIILEEI